MPKITLLNLENLSTARTLDCLDYIKKSIIEKMPLYTVIKENIVAYYDEVELINTYDETEKFLLVAEKQICIDYKRGEIRQLSDEALEELWLHKKLEGEKLSLVFTQDDTSYKFNSLSKIYSVGLDDIYKCIDGTKTKRSGRQKDHYIQAITLAMDELGDKETNEELFGWISKRTENFDNDHNCFSYVDCFEEDLIPYVAASPNDVVLKSNGKVVKKKTFIEACSRLRKKR
jgi:hypothetical protein